MNQNEKAMFLIKAKMKHYDITLYPPGLMRELELKFGPPYPLFKNLIRGGSGSPGLRAYSSENWPENWLLFGKENLRFNIEFRPRSIWIRVNVAHKFFYVIPISRADGILFRFFEDTAMENSRFSMGIGLSLRSGEKVGDFLGIASEQKTWIQIAKREGWIQNTSF